MREVFVSILFCGRILLHLNVCVFMDYIYHIVYIYDYIVYVLHNRYREQKIIFFQNYAHYSIV